VTARSTIAGSTPSTATVSESGHAGRLLIRADSGVRASGPHPAPLHGRRGAPEREPRAPSLDARRPGTAPFAERCGRRSPAPHAPGGGGAVEAALQVRQ